MLATQEFTFRDLAALFDACGLNYVTRPGDQVILASFESQAGSQPMVARLDSERQTVGLYFRLPLTASEHRRVEMAEGVARANYGLLVGFFELDLNDGELSYKVTAPIDQSGLSRGQFEHCMGAALSTIDRYVPALQQIEAGGCPATAMEGL